MVADEQNTQSIAENVPKQRKEKLCDVLKSELDGTAGEKQLWCPARGTS